MSELGVVEVGIDPVLIDIIRRIGKKARTAYYAWNCPVCKGGEYHTDWCIVPELVELGDYFNDD